MELRHSNNDDSFKDDNLHEVLVTPAQDDGFRYVIWHTVAPREIVAWGVADTFDRAIEAAEQAIH